MKRVLLVGDGGWPTGFERVVRAIGTYLQGTGTYEVVHRGIGYHPKQPIKVPDYPYELKPSGQSADDPLAFRQVTRWLKEDRPDVVLMVQDLWHEWEYLHHIPRDLPTIGYFPTDTPNVKWSYALGAAAMTEAIPYTAFGARETAVGIRDGADILLAGYASQGVTLEQEATWFLVPRNDKELAIRADRLAARQNPSAFRPISHGIEPEKFYTVLKKDARHAWGLPHDAFVVLSVNTNQFRKRQDLTIRAFARFHEDHPNSYLVLHCMGGDNQGWDLAQLARLYGVQERVVCTHWAMPELTDEQLLLLYNTADVHLNTGGGEGWGLTSVESALCGVPQLVPDWSATKELWEGVGVLLPVSDYRMEPKLLNSAHALVSTQRTAHLLSYLAENRDALRGIGEACQDRARQFPTWQVVGEQFAERVAEILEPHEHPAMALADIPATRQGVLRSAVHDLL